MRLDQRACLVACTTIVCAASAALSQAAPPPVSPIIVQAMDFIAQGGGKVTIHAHGRGASPAYIHEWCTPGHWLEWTLDCPDAGDYQLLLRYGEKFQTTRSVEINGQPVKGLEILALPSTQEWQNPKDLKAPAPIPLHAGKNTLRINCLDAQSIWLYHISLVRGNKTIAIDPAAFTGQGGGKVQAIISDQHGFFTGWNARGHAFEWTIPNAQAANYTLSLGCASRDVAVRELRVNGRLVKGFESFRAPWTGGWRNWCEVQLPGEVPLQAGRNVLRMTNLEGAINLTYLRLAAPGKPDIFINALDFTAQVGDKARIHIPTMPFIDGWDKAGQWLQWKFNAPAAGRYTVTVRYIGPPYFPTLESPADFDVRPRRFEINGAVVKGLDAYMIPGEALREWRDAELPVPFDLKAGPNVLRITSLADGPLTLYQLRFTPVAQP